MALISARDYLNKGSDPTPSNGGGLTSASDYLNKKKAKQEDRMMSDANEQYQIGQQFTDVVQSPDVMDNRFRQEEQDNQRLQQDQLNQDLIDRQQMDEASRVSDSLPPVEPQRPGRNIPVIGSVLQGLDAFSENPYVDTGASILRSFYTPGAGVANVGGLSNAVNTGISKLLPGLSSTVLGRSAQGLAREVVTGAPVGAGQALTQGGQLDDAAQGALYGAALGGAFGAAGPLIGKGFQAARGAAARDLMQAPQKQSLDAVVNDFTKRVNQETMPSIPISEGPSYQGVNLVSKANDGLQQPRLTMNRPIESIPDSVHLEGQQAGMSDADFRPVITKRTEQDVLKELNDLQEVKLRYEQFPSHTTPELTQEQAIVELKNAKDANDKFHDYIIKTYGPNGVALPDSTLTEVDRKKIHEIALNLMKAERNVSEKAWEPKPIKSLVADDWTKPINEPEYFGYLRKRNHLESELEWLRNPKPTVQASKRPKQPALLPTSEVGGDIQPAPHGKPMAEVSKPNNPDTILSRLGEQIKGDQNLGFSAFGKRTGTYDNLSTDTKSQLVTRTAREPINLRDVTDAGYRKMVDDQYRFKDFDKHAEKVLGRKLNPSEQSHTLALNSRGSDMITHHILTEDLVDINGNVIGRSLKNATQQIPKNKLVDFEDYQVLRHSMFRMDRKENVFHNRFEMTPDKAAQKVASYEASNPEFKKIADELYGFRRNLAKSWLVDTGLVARKTWDGVMESNPFYVSNNRQFLSTEKGGSGAKKGFARQSSPLKPAPGSERKIISPTESDIEHVDQYVKAGKRNQVMQNVVNIAQKDPAAFEGFLEIMPMTDNIKQSELSKLNAIIEKDGVEGLIENINNQFDELFNQAKVAGKKDLNNTIPVMFNGEPVWVKVHDAPFLEALTSLTPQAQGVILEGARQTTRVMKMLTTGVNPVFSLTRNLVRDVPMSYVASKTTDNPFRFGWDFLDSVVSILGNKEMYKSFKAIGGGHSSSIAADRNMLAQSKREILPQRNVRGLPGRILSGVENLTNALETAPRLGEYKRITQAGDNSTDSKIRGLFEANDVTVNFKRRGNVGREIDAFVPYFNAAIQGLDKTMRTFKDKPVAATMKAVGAISLPSMLLYAINYNNPDYKKLDNRTKDLYYLIPNGDGTFTKLPKPREGGAVFGSSIERVMRAFYEHDPDAFRGFAETVRSSFTPPVASGLTKPGSATDKLEGGLVGDSILGPLSDLKSNKDFAERPIVPKYMEGLSPELQYDERTSELSKWIGSKINASPKQLDYLLKSYSGVIGQLGIPLNSEGGSLLKALKQQVTADPTYSNSVFTDFYDNKDKLDTAEKDFKLTGVEPKGYNPGDRKYLDRVSAQISKVRTTMRQVQSDKSLAPADKEKQLKELQVLMTSIAEDANIELKKSK